jgi:hypothetical protein
MQVSVELDKKEKIHVGFGEGQCTLGTCSNFSTNNDFGKHISPSGEDI